MSAESGGAPAAELPRGARLGIDVGSVRIGVAASDPDGLLATPVETVLRGADEARPDLGRIAEIVGELRAKVVYLGLPLHLSGAEGSAAAQIRAYSWALAHAIAPVPVRLVDERLTTVTAHQALYASGRSGRGHRRVVDQAAAVAILQSAIDAERATGARIGEPVLPEGDAGEGRQVRRQDGPGSRGKD